MIQADNPFAPPSDSAPPLSEFNPAGSTSQSWAIRFGLWTIICIVSAGPSFVWGLSTVAEHQVLAMCLGVLIFIVAYTVGDQITVDKPWRKDGKTRLTLRIGFIARMVISVVFPLGGYIDLFCGLVSVRIVELLLSFNGELPDEASFVQTLAITLVQGVILNALLVGVMLIVYLILLAVSVRKASGASKLSLRVPM